MDLKIIMPNERNTYSIILCIEKFKKMQTNLEW